MLGKGRDLTQVEGVKNWCIYVIKAASRVPTTFCGMQEFASFQGRDTVF